MNMLYRQITIHDPEYAKEKELRLAVLRKPLGLALSAEDTQNDGDRIHLVAQDAPGEVVGCVLVEKEGLSARIRQMAVADSHRFKGIGRHLVQFAERVSEQWGCSCVYMHARCEAREFYEKLGYRVMSSVFNELDIPHVTMNKQLANGIRMELKTGDPFDRQVVRPADKEP